MKKLLLPLFAVLAWCMPVFAQNVTNVSVMQEGNSIVVSYDIDKSSPEVSLTVSTDGGKTFSAPLRKVSGDVKDVQPGRRSIVWDVLAERESLKGDNIVFNVIANSGHEWVDLGLSVKWATCNVGAARPEEYGSYYQWAGTEDVTDKSIYLDWSNCPYRTGGYSYDNVKFSKYVMSSKYGTVDNKTVLDPEDDAAHVNWGGSWRMPTDAEWTELRKNCTWTWTSQNGVNGCKITGKKSGYTNNSIFLPAAGCRKGDYIGDVGSRGNYWSSSFGTGYPYRACYSYFYSSLVGGYYYNRYNGLSVRPVSE